MAQWDPQQYEKFSDQRLRAGYDLLARIPMQAFQTVYDLGCGTGQLTRLLPHYWPDAKIVGVDNSPEMLTEARKKPAPIAWEQHDINTWHPAQIPDLIFSNATLQWLNNHAQLIPKLINFLQPEGVLAIQMPTNFNAPSHRLILIAARSGPWRKTLEPLLRPNSVLTPEQYLEILTPITQSQDVWQTTYYSLLSGENPVVEWVKGTFLKPLLDALKEPERSQFLADYSERIKAAYPVRNDGLTLFPFQRLFLVVKR